MFCVMCKACAVHSYCPDKFHTEDDGTVSWKCEDCAPDNPKCLSEQLRKSERISDATEAKYNRMKMQKESCAPRKLKSVRFAEDNENRQPILEDEIVPYEEPESHKVPLSTSPNEQVLESEKYGDSESIISKCMCCPEIDKYSHARPLCDPVWKGQLRLNNGTRFLLAAYMSSKACSKVHSAVTGVPKRLDAEMLLRCVIWPKSFAMFPSNADSIALYLFPRYERDEKIFDGVLHNVIEQDLALRAVVNNVELLIFSSHLLPPDDRRICKKYYFWGVFKPKHREP
ncbi:uncharacterized protein LOC130712298 isoform X2 [Lotus japonicus]|nr:uncharacterized protein LOC130712298 isoform X2 [Lotus japonicus]